MDLSILSFHLSLNVSVPLLYQKGWLRKNILITEFRARTFVNKDDIQLRVAFDQVDTDSSGSIDMDELFNAMRALGREMPMKQVQGIMDEYDTDKSGEIDFDEFKDMMEGLKNKNKLSDDRLLVCIFN